MKNPDTVPCCPRFDPGPWDNQTLTWDNKLFLRDRVRSFLHIPLNFGSVMKRCLAAIEAAQATPQERIILADENSLWGADVYLAIDKEVPGAAMARLSGTYLARVFEGPYRHLKTWVAEMQAHVRAKDMHIRKLYFFYTTCPRCAKRYGRNPVVLLARV